MEDLTEEKLLNDFYNYLIKNQKSENTAASYKASVKTYFNWLSGNGDGFVKLTIQEVREFKSYLKTIKKLKEKTINAKLSALNEFFTFCVDNGINDKDDAFLNKNDYYKIPTKILSPQVLSKAEIETYRKKLLYQENKRAKINPKQKDFYKYKVARDYCIVSFLAYAGLRISECLDLRLEDFYHKLPDGTYYVEENDVNVRNGKGARARNFVMLDEIVEPLKEYLVQRQQYAEKHNKQSEYLFFSRESNKMDRSTVNKLLGEYCNGANPHKFRHFLASYLMNNRMALGIETEEVMAITGHKDPRTLLIYVHPDKYSLRDKLRKGKSEGLI